MNLIRFVNLLVIGLCSSQIGFAGSFRIHEVSGANVLVWFDAAAKNIYFKECEARVYSADLDCDVVTSNEEPNRTIGVISLADFEGNVASTLGIDLAFTKDDYLQDGTLHDAIQKRLALLEKYAQATSPEILKNDHNYQRAMAVIDYYKRVFAPLIKKITEPGHFEIYKGLAGSNLGEYLTIQLKFVRLPALYRKALYNLPNGEKKTVSVFGFNAEQRDRAFTNSVARWVPRNAVKVSDTTFNGFYSKRGGIPKWEFSYNYEKSYGFTIEMPFASWQRNPAERWPFFDYDKYSDRNKVWKLFRFKWEGFRGGLMIKDTMSVRREIAVRPYELENPTLYLREFCKEQSKSDQLISCIVETIN